MHQIIQDAVCKLNEISRHGTERIDSVVLIYREKNSNWTIFVVLWTTGIAYMSATIFYQAMRFDQHPQRSLAWILGLLLVFCSVLFALWRQGKKHDSV